MNLAAVFGAGLLAGATTCAVTQGGLLVGLLARQKKQGARAEGSGWADDLVPVLGFLAGKLIVLTALGAVLGALGSLVNLDAALGGWVQILAAVLMVFFGLAAAGVPGLRDFQFVPPQSWTQTVRRSTRSQSALAPFLLGLATVLIPCGVTISMMLLASTSGSAATGALVMAVFVLGTAPLFAAYGFLAHRFAPSRNGTAAVALGVVVVLMGLVTLNAGLNALGSPVTAQTIAARLMGRSSAPAGPAVAASTEGGTQVVRIDARSDGYYPSEVTAKAGVPTKVVFHTDNTRSCILATTLPTFGMQAILPQTGDKEFDLGVLEAGDIPISCSMGMYTGTIHVQ